MTVVNFRSSTVCLFFVQAKDAVRGADEKGLRVVAMSYIATLKLVFFLVNNTEVWIYTTRTSPACRAAVWNVSECDEHLQTVLNAKAVNTDRSEKALLKIRKFIFNQRGFPKTSLW